MEKCKDPFVRLIMADTAQEFVNNLDVMYPDGGASDKTVNKLKKYFKSCGIPIPVLPSDNRRDDIIKNMYRVWASLECNDLMCSLLGTENKDDENET